MAKVQDIRGGMDSISNYIKCLKEAEDLATTKKVGIHSKQEQKSHVFTDYSNKNNKKSAVKFYEYIKNEKDLKGVVELVLNGSYFKVRLDKFKCYTIMKLQGIKTL